MFRSLKLVVIGNVRGELFKMLKVLEKLVFYFVG